MQRPNNAPRRGHSIAIPDAEIEWTAIRAQGAGGQNEMTRGKIVE